MHSEKVRCSIVMLDECIKQKAANFPSQSITAALNPSVGPVRVRFVTLVTFNIPMPRGVCFPG